MNKLELIKKFQEKTAADLAVLTQAALAAHGAATHAESKAEDKYDTRGLEASYLAGAQSKRAMELQEMLDLFHHLDLKEFNASTKIASTALVELDCDGQKAYCLLMPKGGGQSVVYEGKTVQCITPQSPLGELLLGAKVGDQISVTVKGVLRDYDIVSAW